MAEFSDTRRIEGGYTDGDGVHHDVALELIRGDNGEAQAEFYVDDELQTADDVGITLECPRCEIVMQLEVNEECWVCNRCQQIITFADINQGSIVEG